MAVSTTNAYSGPYLTNGSTTVFPFSFTAPTAGEVSVVLRDADGVETVASGFTVSLTAGGGGSVTFSVAPASGYSLYVLLDPDFTQEIDFEDGSPWIASPVNEGYDRAAARDQALKRDIDRSISLPVGESAGALPSAAARAGKFISFDPAGDPIVSEGTGVDPGLRTDLASVSGASLVKFAGGKTVEDLASTATGKGASLVGYAADAAYPAGTLGNALSYLDQHSEGGFWSSWDATASGLPVPPGSQQSGGRTQRMMDKLRLGWATECSDDFPATTKDKYEAFEAARTDARGFRTSWSTAAVGAKNGGIAVLGYSFSSDSNLDGLQLGMGVMGAAVNDNTTHKQHVCGGYFVAWRLPNTGQDVAGTGTIGGEVDVCNLGNSVQITPGNLYPTTGFTTAWQVNSGAYDDAATTASAAISIGNNKADFLSGIVFGATALDGLTFDGNGQPIAGQASAVRMAAFQQLEWWTYPWSAPSFTISSEQLTAANAQSIKATDTGIFFGGPQSAGRALQTIYPGGATGAWVGVTPAFGANPPTIEALGQTNSDLRLRGVGTGGVNIVSPGNVSRIYATTTGLGFFGSTPIAKPTITGSRGSNAALASLLTQLAAYGLITDSTT